MGIIIRNDVQVECFPGWQWKDVKALHQHIKLAHRERHKATNLVTREGCAGCDKIKARGEANSVG